MYLIPKENLKGSTSSKYGPLPILANITCPNCKVLISSHFGWVPAHNIGAMSVNKCQNCEIELKFTYLYIGISGNCYVYPNILKRTPLSGLTNVTTITDNFREQYQSLLDVYNMGNWVAASMLIRRLLETIVKGVLPDDKKNKTLAEQLKYLHDSIDAKATVQKLTEAIRKAGNSAVHNTDVNPTNETTTALLDLLDSFLEFMYVLPLKIDTLNNVMTETYSK